MCFLRLTVAAALTLLLAGCEVGAGGTTSFGDGSGTGGTSTAGTTAGEGGSGSGDGLGYTPDPQACEPKTCTVETMGEDCCVGVQPGLPSACPSMDYPNNWSCDENGMCVHGGCSDDADCLIPGFECVDLGGGSQCVAVCNLPSGGTGGDCEDCDDCEDPEDVDMDGIAHFLPGTECIGVAAGGVMYCSQPLP